jgi:hypothetical protein
MTPTVYAFRFEGSSLSGADLARLALERIYEQEPKAWEADGFLVVVVNAWRLWGTGGGGTG